MNKEIKVGNIIKNIRINKKFLLKDIAKKAGISASMLSQIEKGTANPSLNTIKEIASALDVPLFKFFIEPESKKNNISILKKDDRKIMVSKNITYELFSPEINTNLECMEMIFHKKNSESSNKPKSHRGEEVAVVLKGKVQIEIEGATAIMTEGDSVHIPSLKSHKWTNLNNDKSIVLFVVTPPEF